MDQFGHVFLIPSDGSYEASMSLAAEQGQSTSMWKAGCPGEGKDLLSLMNSLSFEEAAASSGKQPSLSQGGAASRSGISATSTGECGSETAVAASLGTGRGCESGNRGKRGVVAALRGRRLPDVQHLLMNGGRTQTVPQPGEVQMEQIMPQEQHPTMQQVDPRQEGQFGVPSNLSSPNPSTKRFQVETASQPVKPTARGRQGEKSFASRGCSLLTDSSLALQTALVTMLHLQKQGLDPQRKPIIPKRNLMCLSFLRLGMCPNRETCNYAHNMVELQKKLELRKTSLCKYWLKGKCENEDCNFAHGEHELQSTVGVFKTTICKYWRQGCCYSGEFCRHAHGEADLRPENLPPHLERKKLQQQSRMLNRNSVVASSGRRRGRSDVCDGEDLESALDEVLKQQSEVTFDCLRQVICDSGVFPESKGGAPASSFDTLLSDVKESRGQRRLTQGSNSSDLSTDVLLSSASESPRGVPSRSGTSLSSSSTWSVSPEHTFAPAMGGISVGGSCTLPPVSSGGRRPPEAGGDSRSSLDLKAFACHGAPPNFMGMRCNTAPPPGLSGVTVLRSMGSDGSVRGFHDPSDFIEGSIGSGKDPRPAGPAVAGRAAQLQRSIKWPASW